MNSRNPLLVNRQYLSIYNPSSSMIFNWSKPTTDWPSMIVTGVL